MGVWETLQGELATATYREFERRALPLMRLFRLDMVQAPEMQGLDRAGIDLLVWSDNRCFPWVVQCKGFKEKEDLGRSQIDQILASIESFRKSNFSCDTYILLHNRVGANRAAVAEIERSLSILQQENKATATLIWDRQIFIRETRKRLLEITIDRIRENAEHLLDKHNSLFRFGSIYIQEVPVSERLLRIRRNEQVDLTNVSSERTRRHATELVYKPSTSRWNLLLGEFGTGKTTTALHAARSTGRKVIYVQAEGMPDRSGGVGTNLMLGRVAEAMRLFDDQMQAFIHRLVGRSIASLLTGHDAGYVLVIDGLDENRMYSRADGIKHLTNELAELRCPIVITTRKSHFFSTFSNFVRNIEDLSIKGGTKRDASLFDLELWTNHEVKELVVAARRIATSAETIHLRWLLDALDNGEAQRLYGDLPYNPLFLQMILEETAAGRIIKMNRVELIRQWIEQKIRRDLLVSRYTPTEVIDVDTFVEDTMFLLERVACRMIALDNEGIWSLTEHISSENVEEEARQIFRENKVDISSILGCSVLSAVSPRSRGVMPVRFVLRICQEFFLALHLHRAGEEPKGYPDSIVILWEELKQSNERI